MIFPLWPHAIALISTEILDGRALICMEKSVILKALDAVKKSIAIKIKTVVVSRKIVVACGVRCLQASISMNDLNGANC